MQLVNAALFLNAKNIFLMSIKPLSASFVRIIFFLTAMYGSLKLNKTNHSIDVLNVIYCLACIYLQHYLNDHELVPIFQQ